MGVQDGMRNFYGGTVQWSEKAFLIKSGEGTKNLADKKTFLGIFLPNMGGWGHCFPNKNHKFWMNKNSPFVFPKLTKTLGCVGG